MAMREETLYQIVANDPSGINWKDLCSDCLKWHSGKDWERAMMTGGSMDSATAGTMLGKWRKPWMFFPMLIVSVVLTVLLLLVYFIMMLYAGGVSRSFVTMMLIIPPLLIPIVMMIFFWELNIPRNISIYRLFGYFFLGGFLCFAFNTVMLQLIPDGIWFDGHWFSVPSLAALREEPAKLGAALLFLWIFSAGRKKTVYGFTGLVIGAAVGAGFSGFESVSYALNNGIETVILRMVWAISGHVVFCAPYMAAIALNMENGKFRARSFGNKDFLMTFSFSIAMHALWNWSFPGMLDFFKSVLITGLLWYMALYIVRKCLYQAVQAGTAGAGSAVQYHQAAYPGGGYQNQAAYPGGGYQNQAAYQGNRYQNQMAYPGGGYQNQAAYQGSRYQNQAVRQDGGYQGQTASLIVQGAGGRFQGMSRQFCGEREIRIGRDERADLRLPQVPGVSRTHCVVRRHGQQWTILDLNSSYGVYRADGRRLSPGTEHLLQSGEVICLGAPENRIQFLFRM